MKYTNKEIEEMIKNDFMYITDWQGLEWGEDQENELKRLIKDNRDSFRKHLEEHGDISCFQYDSK